MEAGAELVSVQAQLQQLRAELGLAPASPSRSAPASTSAHRRSSDPDSHNADTFGSEAQNEEADDAVNDETFGLEATYETRHDAHNEEVREPLTPASTALPEPGAARSPPDANHRTAADVWRRRDI